ncbi:DUF4129 domain-containing protein [Georgenia sp. SUBG003]|uniref:DUF4129 domain-containing protein n=1 Tax=Georgenia sp. SUBG003 TaxID=1497974 RepID=UPI0004D37885|nr:hypothetical protein DA06_08580 [Georgenia sp. SUBG003]
MLPLAGRWRRRAGRRRAVDDASRVEGEWRVLTTRLADLGIPAPVGATPRQAAEHYGREAALTGTTAEALSRTVATLERARYAPGGANPGTMGADVRAVVAQVRSTRSWRRRLRALIVPVSGIEQLRAWGDRAGAMGRARSLRPEA